MIIISKAAGFVRDMIMANYFGTSTANDAYVAAYSLFYLPILLFNSCITSTLVPLYIKSREEKGLAGANRFASNTLNMFIVAAGVVAALMYFLAGPLVGLVYGQFDPATAQITVRLTQIMMLSLVFNIASIVISTLLNANEHYITAQLTGFPLSFCVIVASVLFSARFGIEAVAWGVFFSGILQVVVLLPGLRGWFKYRPVLDVKDRQFRRLLVMAVPAILSMAVSELNHMVNNWMAAGVSAGAISALSYAYKLITFITGILVVPLTTIVFSKMSKMVAEKNTAGVLKTLRRCVELILMVVLPITAIAMVLNWDVITFAYRSGRFGADSVAMTAGCFLFYVLGVPTFGIRDLLNRTFHSMQDTKTPFRVACMVVALNIVLCFILRGPMGANGLALATTVSGASGAFALLLLLRKHFGRTGLKRSLPELGKIFAATLICAAVCAAINALMPVSQNRWDAFLKLAISAVGSLGAYAIACLLLRVKQLRGLLGGRKRA